MVRFCRVFSYFALIFHLRSVSKDSFRVHASAWKTKMRGRWSHVCRFFFGGANGKRELDDRVKVGRGTSPKNTSCFLLKTSGSFLSRSFRSSRLFVRLEPRVLIAIVADEVPRS